MAKKVKEVSKQEVIASMRAHLEKFNYVVSDIHFISVNDEKELKKLNAGSASPMGYIITYSKLKLMPTIVINTEFIFLLVSSEALPHANCFMYEVFVK